MKCNLPWQQLVESQSTAIVPLRNTGFTGVGSPRTATGLLRSVFPGRGCTSHTKQKVVAVVATMVVVVAVV